MHALLTILAILGLLCAILVVLAVLIALTQGIATMIRKPKTEPRLETEAETLFTSKGQNHDAL